VTGGDERTRGREEARVSDVSRRTLLLGAGALGVAGFAAPAGAASGVSAGPLQTPSPAPAPVAAPDLPHRSHFVPGLGTRFQAAGDAGTYPLDLVDILDVAATAGDRERSFNLIFAAADGATPGEGMYRVAGAGVAAVHLFLSPVGSHTGRRELQALVNRSA
jgi:hypothetical protein